MIRNWKIPNIIFDWGKCWKSAEPFFISFSREISLVKAGNLICSFWLLTQHAFDSIQFSSIWSFEYRVQSLSFFFFAAPTCITAWPSDDATKSINHTLEFADGTQQTWGLYSSPRYKYGANWFTKIRNQSLLRARKIWWHQVFIFVHRRLIHFQCINFYGKRNKNEEFAGFNVTAVSVRVSSNRISRITIETVLFRVVFFWWNSNSFWQVCTNVIMILNLIQDNNCGEL